MRDSAPPPGAPDFQALFHATPAPLLVLTPGLRIAAVNDAYLEATATVRDDLLGRSLFDAFPDNPDAPEADAVANLHASLQRVLERGVTDTMPLQRYDIRVRDGDTTVFVPRHWSPINTPVFDADGALTHIVHRVVDVTALVDSNTRATRLEAEVAAQAMELQNAVDRLRDANRRLEREHALREQFVLSLTHDLRTPLSAATMGAHVIACKPEDADEVRRIGVRVRANLDRIDRMLRDLLDANRVSAGGALTVSVAPCNLRDVASAVIDDLGTVHGARFRLHARAAPVGHWDCDALRRVLENLAGNAIRHGRPGGPVTITLDASAAHAVIEVHNEGAAIPDDEQSAIFQPHFRRQAPEHEGRTGWGLGLTVVRAIVDAHGGSVEVSSAPGEGTVFRVRLPLAAGGPDSG